VVQQLARSLPESEPVVVVADPALVVPLAQVVVLVDVLVLQCAAGGGAPVPVQEQAVVAAAVELVAEFAGAACGEEAVAGRT
jgi:hypothetical protein